jgi:hypothetical protein
LARVAVDHDLDLASSLTQNAGAGQIQSVRVGRKPRVDFLVLLSRSIGIEGQQIATPIDDWCGKIWR